MQTLNPYFSGAAIGPLSETMFANQQNYKKFTFHILQEILFSVPIAMYFPKNFYLVQEINKKVGIIQSTGLIDYWISFYLNSAFMKFQTSKSPKKLNLSHLSGGFLLWAGGCLLGMLFFISELFIRTKNVHHFKNIKK